MIKLAVDKITNWIFVTGVPRAGTTFVGKVLSLPLKVDYIHEPFNPGCGMAGMKQRYRYMRSSLDGEEMMRYHEKVERIFSYDFNLKTSRYSGDSKVRRALKSIVGSRGPFYLRIAKVNPFHEAAVIKDPTGSLLAKYLYTRFDVTPVIVVKHPVSLMASLKRIGWQPNLHWFREQPYLVEDHFSDERNFIYREWTDPVEKTAVHWRILYKVMLEQASRHPDWQVITHEALCQHPQHLFRDLYEALDLPWSRRVKQKVRTLTEGASARARGGRLQDLRRNSAGIFEMRRDSIPKEERHAIFDIVQDVASQVYSRESFAID